VTEFRWIARRVILTIHAEQLAEHGGRPGIRDEGLLDSALARPEMKAHDGETDLAVIAAAYAYGLALNHPFIDGNKRTAFVALELFLAKNGHRLTASDEDAVITFLKLASGDLSEAALAEWVRAHLEAGAP
jgi:death-on-curing protein